MTNPQVPPEPPRAPDVSPKPEPSPVVKPEPKPVERATTPVPRTTVPFTKMAAAWWALIVGTLVLIVFLVFIGQNLQSTTIYFLGWQWNTRVGIGFLVAAICGSLITVATGGARMVQLRRAAKKNLRHPAPPSPPR
jgi:uncharacterized integral membrane protein